jgi:hypothetical protein
MRYVLGIHKMSDHNDKELWSANKPSWDTVYQTPKGAISVCLYQRMRLEVSLEKMVGPLGQLTSFKRQLRVGYFIMCLHAIQCIKLIIKRVYKEKPNQSSNWFKNVMVLFQYLVSTLQLYSCIKITTRRSSNVGGVSTIF